MNNWQLLLTIWAIGLAVVGPAFSKVLTPLKLNGLPLFVMVALWPLALTYGLIVFGYGKAQVEAKK